MEFDNIGLAFTLTMLAGLATGFMLMSKNIIFIKEELVKINGNKYRIGKCNILWQDNTNIIWLTLRKSQ